MQDKGSQKLKNAVLQLKEGMQQRDSLMLRFNESYPSFIPRLKERFPDLTQNDLEFCALVRLNLSYKDIANVMNIRHQSVFTKKYRITQKMKVEEDTGFQQVILET
ncbi:MAG: hypothetical protein RLY31_2911 [Bacteroidota bacterium]